MRFRLRALFVLTAAAGVLWWFCITLSVTERLRINGYALTERPPTPEEAIERAITITIWLVCLGVILLARPDRGRTR